MSPESSPLDGHTTRFARATMALSPADRRAWTADLLNHADRRSDPDERRRYLVAAAQLNFAVADAIAHRYRHLASDDEELLDCARQALLQAIAAFKPEPGTELFAHVIPVVRDAVRTHVRLLVQ